MNHFWEIVGSNALVATILAFGVTAVSRVWRNNAAIHLLWVVVLLKFFTPPMVTARVPFVSNWFGQVAVVEPTHKSAAQRVVASEQQTGVPDVADTGAAVVGDGKPYSVSGTLPAVADRRPWSIWTALAVIWILGSAGVAAAYALRVRRFARLVRDVDQPPRVICEMVDQLAGRLSLYRVPKVVMTRLTIPPLVWCIGFRPRLILPSQLFARLDGTAQCSILAHELAHIRRGDYLIRFVELAATTVFWWHPVVWWACRELHELEEQCCDSRGWNWYRLKHARMRRHWSIRGNFSRNNRECGCRYLPPFIRRDRFRGEYKC